MYKPFICVAKKEKNRVLFVAEAEKCNAQDTLEYGHRHDNT